MKTKLFSLLTLSLIASPAFALDCKQKVEIAVMSELPSQEEYDVTAALETNKRLNDGDTQLWYVTIDSGVDGGGKWPAYAVTSGEGQAACVIKGIFGF